VIIRLDRDDLNALKAQEIANSEDTAYLLIDDGTVLDQTGNPNTPRINGLNALMVDMYMEDMSGPILQNFNLNLTSDTLTLLFDETVRVSTLDVNQITLYGYNNSVQYTLTNDSFSASANGPEVVHLT